jgi:hypothetical protein
MSKFLLAFIAASILAQPALAQAAAKIQFATGGLDGCSAEKIAQIKSTFSEAIRLADAAVTALAKPDVVKSQAFIDFLGGTSFLFLLAPAV